MENKNSSGVPQFATAEYSSPSGAAACKSCGKPIIGAQYRVNGAPVCASCARAIKDKSPKDTHAAFVRGVLFGVGAAILGLAIYVAFALATGLIAGIVSLAVGFIVGKAILMGSGGVGGRRYQIAAVLLTYMAVSLAAVPIAISQHMKQKNAQQATQSSQSATPAAPKIGALKALGVLTMVGLASPFLGLSNPMQGVIGLIILFVGIRIAWRMTAAKPINIVGPISEAAPATHGLPPS
ncbi:MAG TPA: hypothetical protein VGI65_10325 [Steroidobacteraceae bacterium]|jgi:uncharacterized protein (DUF983 family)